MSIQTIREVLGYIPEVKPLVKRAFVEREFPTDNKDSTLMSALVIEYLTKIAGESIPLDTRDKVFQAVHLYKLGNDLTHYSQLMCSRSLEKVAQEKRLNEEVRQAENVIEAMTAGLVDIEKIASKAESLYDGYGEYVSSDTVKKYAGAGFLHKEAAELALAARYQTTKNEGFMKVAQVIHATDPFKLDAEDKRFIARSVTDLDRECGLYGYNFYEDAFLTKEAEIKDSVSIDLGGKKVSISRIIAVAPSLEEIIGKDVVKEISTGSPEAIKAVISSLPLDLKKIIATYA